MRFLDLHQERSKGWVNWCEAMETTREHARTKNCGQVESSISLPSPIQTRRKNCHPAELKLYRMGRLLGACRLVPRCRGYEGVTSWDQKPVCNILVCINHNGFAVWLPYVHFSIIYFYFSLCTKQPPFFLLPKT